MSESPEQVDHPAHYAGLSPEPITVIEAWGLGFHCGNALKYIARAGNKGDAIEDLSKARWYLDREIARRQTAPAGRASGRLESLRCTRCGKEVSITKSKLCLDCYAAYYPGDDK